MRLDTVGDAVGDSPAQRLGLLVRIGEDLDHRSRAVEHRHGAAAILSMPSTSAIEDGNSRSACARIWCEVRYLMRRVCERPGISTLSDSHENGC
jgi:hypothetical protein